VGEFRLDVEIDDRTGQLRRLRDRERGMDVLHFQPGVELELNERPVRSVEHTVAASRHEHLTRFDAQHQPAYKVGQRLNVTRRITLGGLGLHTGAPDSAHLRYEIQRTPWGDWDNSLDQMWQAPLEAPLHVETLGVLTAPTAWFGPKTRLRTLAIGGSGPREHVSLEDGPVAEVTPYLQTAFRTAFPGQISTPGALYYDPDDERFVWVLCRHGDTGGRIEFREDGQSYRFAYFTPMKVYDRILTPEVSLFWGQGLDEADRILAEQFDKYEEPPQDWWYKTAWFWLHPMWQPNASFKQTEEAIRILADAGVKGFGLGVHDIPWAGRDIDVRTFRASPRLGGDDGMRRVADAIAEVGGHSFVWTSRTGTGNYGEFRERWSVRGEDGRPLWIQSGAGSGVTIDMCNDADPTFREHLFDMVAYWLDEIGVDGLFWDSGYQPMPPDFVPREELNHPGQAMTAPMRFYEEVYRFARSIRPDFFMWAEGLSTEAVSNGFSVDHAKHGLHSGHRLMHRIAHVGPRRLVWRSAWNQDVAGGFPFIQPQSDIGMDPGPESYRKIADDPMNRWLCGFVAELVGRDLGARGASGRGSPVLRRSGRACGTGVGRGVARRGLWPRCDSGPGTAGRVDPFRAARRRRVADGAGLKRGRMRRSGPGGVVVVEALAEVVSLRLAVKQQTLTGRVVPAETGDSAAGLVAKCAPKRFTLQDGEDLVGEVANVPELEAQRVRQHLTRAGGSRQQHGHVARRGLQRRQAERLADARHDEDVGVSKEHVNVGPADEPGEPDVVAEAQLVDQVFHRRDGVARPRDDELRLGCASLHLQRGAKEHLGALLPGDAAEKQHRRSVRPG